MAFPKLCLFPRKSVSETAQEVDKNVRIHFFEKNNLKMGKIG